MPIAKLDVWTPKNVVIAIALLVACFGINSKLIKPSAAEISTQSAQEQQIKTDQENKEKIANGEPVPIESFETALESGEEVVLTMPDGSKFKGESSYQISDQVRIENIKWKGAWGQPSFMAVGHLYVNDKESGYWTNVEVQGFIRCSDGTVEYEGIWIWPSEITEPIVLPSQNKSCWTNGKVPEAGVPAELLKRA